MKKTKKNSPLLVCVQKGSMPKTVYEKLVEGVRSSLKKSFQIERFLSEIRRKPDDL